MKKLTSLIVVLLIAGKLFSQDTLPDFTLVESGDRVVISWTNPYQNQLVQLNIQRSYDSIRNFSTIYSATSPELPQNGFTSTIPPTNRIFYRIFYVLQGGSYFFTKAKRASGISTSNAGGGGAVNSRDINSKSLSTVIPFDKRVITIKIRDTVYAQLSINAFRNFRDSILYKTRDTLYAINDSLVGLRPHVGRELWRASNYIYVNKDGYIYIALPHIADKKYSIKFFEDNGSSLFEIRNVKESPLILEKANFVHSGWFLFELYEDNKLKEKNRIYLPKDF